MNTSKMEISTSRQLSTTGQRVAQASWVLFAVLALAFVFFELNLTYNNLLNPSINLRENLAAIGLSLQAHAVYLVLLRTIYLLVHFVIAGTIIVKRPGEQIALVVAFCLVLMGTVFWPLSERIANQPDFWRLPRAIAQFLSTSTLMIFFFVFPDGQFVPRWSRVFMVVITLFLAVENFFPSSALNPQNWNRFYGAGLSLMTMMVMIYAPVYRYRNVSNPTVRQQTKWVVYGTSIAVVGYFLIALPVAFNLGQMEAGSAYGLVAVTGMMFFFLCIPLSIGIAVLRYRLWDINPIINRTLVYGTLSASTVVLYVVVIGLVSNYFQNSQVNFILSFLATGVIAVLFDPLRQRLQRAVNRFMYGERDDPATVLTRLSQRIDSALAPASVLQTIVETLAQTLHLPYTAITLSLRDEKPNTLSEFGTPVPEVVRVPLSYQTERIGELILAPRAPGESFSTADTNLINIIAQQAGVAVHTYRLTGDLQRSREKLVTAQEEERRRLRRDLHDGIGPTLASFSQRLDTAAEMVAQDPQKSVELLKELKGQVKGAIAEIRQLVYALRPPVLDEFGLATAIREHLAPYMGPNGLQITFDVTDPMPALPAAVEVASYRIVLEAFTNITHHAQATTCHIALKVEQGCLLVDVCDNGKGFSSREHPGVGLASMRERAAELGGQCMIENIPSGGTRVHARLPLGEE